MQHSFSKFSVITLPSILGLLFGSWLLLYMPFIIGAVLGLDPQDRGLPMALVLAIDFAVIHAGSRLATLISVRDGEVVHYPAVTFVLCSVPFSLLVLFLCCVQISITSDGAFTVLYLVLALMGVYTGLRDGFKSRERVSLGDERGL